MRSFTASIAFACAALFLGRTTARGGPALFTDEAAFRAVVGAVREIDFETLPDGSPSYFGPFITPAFDYTAQGLDFFPHANGVFIASSPACPTGGLMS